jgi:hypothetical protein
MCFHSFEKENKKWDLRNWVAQIRVLLLPLLLGQWRE